MRFERKHVFSGGWLIDETFASTACDETKTKLNMTHNNACSLELSSIDTSVTNTVTNSSFLLLKKILSKYMIPESSMVFLRLTSHKEWIPTDLSELDITDRKVLELIDNNNVVQLLNLRSKSNEGSQK